MAPRGFECVGIVENDGMTEAKVARQIDNFVRLAEPIHQFPIRDQHKQLERPPFADYGGTVRTDAPLEYFDFRARRNLDRDDARIGEIAEEQSIAVKLFRERLITIHACAFPSLIFDAANTTQKNPSIASPPINIA